MLAMAKSKSSGLKQRFSPFLGWGLVMLGSAIVVRAFANLDEAFAGYGGEWIPASAAGSFALATALIVAGAGHLRSLRRAS
jgi:hypothetical protein